MRPNTSDPWQWTWLQPRYWLTWLGLGISRLLATLPYPLLLALGSGLGWLLYRLAHSRVSIARTNLAHCFPERSDQDRERLLKANLASVGIGVMEVIMAWWWPRHRLEQHVHFVGLEHLQPTDGDGKGTLLLLPHFTTIEIAGAFMALRHRLHATYRPHKNPVFEYIQQRQRQCHLQGRLLARRNVRGMLQALRAGDTVLYLPDQDYGAKHSVFAPFFKVPAATVTGTARLAKLGKARVVPMTVTRLPNSQGYELTLHAPWQNFPTGDAQADAERVNQFVETQVRKQPEQYIWVHRRFKTRPPGASPLY